MCQLCPRCGRGLWSWGRGGWPDYEAVGSQQHTEAVLLSIAAIVATMLQLCVCYQQPIHSHAVAILPITQALAPVEEPQSPGQVRWLVTGQEDIITPEHRSGLEWRWWSCIPAALTASISSLYVLYQCCPADRKSRFTNNGSWASGLLIIPYGLVGFLLPLKTHVPHPYSQPVPWDLLAMVVATMQAWVLESQPQ